MLSGRDCKRGDVIRVDLDPTKGREQCKTRPCVVVRTDLLKRSPIVAIVPIQDAGVKDVEEIPFLVPLEKGEGGLTKDSLANAIQVRTVDESRIVERLGTLKPSTMKRISAALMFTLGLD